ncbi:hypothetical protein O3G_MSEX013345 [Manduca sexta]|uniref:Uncharacterized protein n=1 Tax=Manduca sexta TaxID=7130 RepID=A0A921ZSH1_MANSE|nr:hypothetical protein O3G_MSEX013345 [Manduca sexta]KAG6462578.1 hypothetical protein O3G_MSEX013345 [Manduca sexta]
MWCWRRMLGYRRLDTTRIRHQAATIRFSTVHAYSLSLDTFLSEATSLERVVVHGKVEGTRPPGRTLMLRSIQSAVYRPVHKSTKITSNRHMARDRDAHCISYGKHYTTSASDLYFL